MKINEQMDESLSTRIKLIIDEFHYSIKFHFTYSCILSYISSIFYHNISNIILKVDFSSDENDP